MSADIQHTPGPWRANSSWIEGPKMALRVAVVDWPKRSCAPRTKEEAQANARLIAAAPNLLTALKEMVKKHPKCSHPIGCEGSPARLAQEDQEAAIELALAAIKAAEA